MNKKPREPTPLEKAMMDAILSDKPMPKAQSIDMMDAQSYSLMLFAKYRIRLLAHFDESDMLFHCPYDSLTFGVEDYHKFGQHLVEHLNDTGKPLPVS